MKHLTMQFFSPVFHYFLQLRSENYLQSLLLDIHSTSSLNVWDKGSCLYFNHCITKKQMFHTIK